MSEEQDPQQPLTRTQRVLVRYPLYVRIGFGLILAFGMVGNCAGHREGSVLIFIMTAVLWACSRIIQEAIDSWRLLSLMNKLEKPEKKDPPRSDE
jgi:hypothetical protein